GRTVGYSRFREGHQQPENLLEQKQQIEKRVLIHLLCKSHGVARWGFSEKQLERCSFVHFAFYLYFPIRVVHDLLHDIKSDSSPFHMMMESFEHTKYRRPHAEVHPHPVVSYGDNDVF